MLEGFLCVDFEASALMPGSYPIELGVADPVSGAFQSWLIRPTPEWLVGGVWSAESEAIHGITRDRLAASGLPAAEVLARFAAVAGDRVLLSDNPSFDWDWFEKLADEAGHLEFTSRYRVIDVAGIAAKVAAGRGLQPDRAWEEALRRAVVRFPHTHRAGADARQLAEALRLLAKARG